MNERKQGVEGEKEENSNVCVYLSEYLHTNESKNYNRDEELDLC